jgi:hypothetical protein
MNAQHTRYKPPTFDLEHIYYTEYITLALIGRIGRNKQVFVQTDTNLDLGKVADVADGGCCLTVCMCLMYPYHTPAIVLKRSPTAADSVHLMPPKRKRPKMVVKMFLI